MPTIKAKLFNNDIEFLIDAGTRVKMISNHVFKKMSNIKVALQKSVSLIYAHGCTDPLNTKGMFHAKISSKDKDVSADFYVIENSSSRQSRFLGDVTAQSLNIVHFAFSSFTQGSIYTSIFHCLMTRWGSL